jgi:hypothetical protein
VLVALTRPPVVRSIRASEEVGVMAEVTAEAQVRTTLEQMVAALNAGDRRQLGDCLSRRDVAVHIGTDPAEWWTSKDVVDSADGGSEPGVSLVLDSLSTHPVTGDVAWAVGRGRFRNTTGAERPVRLSAVLTRENDRWTVVHSHASIGVPNAAMFD